jgi:hypothetical protein
MRGAMTAFGQSGHSNLGTSLPLVTDAVEKGLENIAEQ